MNNGDTLAGVALCPGPVLGGGYTVTVSRPGDQDKLIAAATFPSDADTWTVVLGASANVDAFTLTVFATCSGE